MTVVGPLVARLNAAAGRVVVDPADVERLLEPPAGRVPPSRLFEVGGVVVAASLPRPGWDDDLLVPWCPEAAAGCGDRWEVVERGLSLLGPVEGVARAQLLGLPFAVEGSDRHLPAVVDHTRAGGSFGRPPVVVDTSFLWAGPLCGHLLALAGCRVIRTGPPPVHLYLDEGKEVRELADPLLDEADVVIESCRGHVNAVRRSRVSEGALWVSITGYGLDDSRVALGDDAAVAAGVVSGFGGAIADPITGLTAAVAALEALAEARVGVLEVTMAGATAAAFAGTRRRAAAEAG